MPARPLEAVAAWLRNRLRNRRRRARPAAVVQDRGAGAVPLLRVDHLRRPTQFTVDEALMANGGELTKREPGRPMRDRGDVALARLPQFGSASAGSSSVPTLLLGLLIASLLCILARSRRRCVVALARFPSDAPSQQALGLADPPGSLSTLLPTAWRVARHHMRLVLGGRETQLEEAVLVLQAELERSEAQIARSSREIERCRGLLHQRAGLLASLLLPNDDTADGGAQGPCSANALHQRKVAEMATLLLDILNWKLGQGPPLPRTHFWRAYAVCEAMVRDLAPSAEAALGCARQLQRLVLEFELQRTGVPLEWRWRRAGSGAFAPVGSAGARRSAGGGSGGRPRGRVAAADARWEQSNFAPFSLAPSSLAASSLDSSSLDSCSPGSSSLSSGWRRTSSSSPDSSTASSTSCRDDAGASELGTEIAAASEIGTQIAAASEIGAAVAAASEIGTAVAAGSGGRGGGDMGIEGGAGRGGGGTLYGWPAAPPSPTSDTEGEDEPWVLQLNRELPFSQLLPEAVPADAAGSWLVSSRFKPRAEEVLQGQKRALWRLELPGATVRGIPAAVVEHARDQANALLRRYQGHPAQEPHVRAWLRAVRRDATPPALRISLAEWEGTASRLQPAPLQALSLSRPSFVGGDASSAGPAHRASALAGAAAPAAAASPSPLVRVWTLPVGGTLVWLNDLPCGSAVSVRVGGVAVRTLDVGDRFELLMHTVGVGSYGWRRLARAGKHAQSGLPMGAPDDAAAGAAAGACKQGAQGRSGRSLSARYTTEIRVVAVDAITQYGTFCEPVRSRAPDTSTAEGDGGEAGGAASPPHAVGDCNLATDAVLHAATAREDVPPSLDRQEPGSSSDAQGDGSPAAKAPGGTVRTPARLASRAPSPALAQHEPRPNEPSSSPAQAPATGHEVISDAPSSPFADGDCAHSGDAGGETPHVIDEADHTAAVAEAATCLVRFVAFARSTVSVVADRTGALSLLPAISEHARALESTSARLAEVTGCSARVQTVLTSLQRLPSTRDARRRSCDSLAREFSSHTPESGALGVGLEAHAACLMLTAVRGALAGPAPRAREQLRRLNSPQVESARCILLAAAQMARPASAAALQAAAARLQITAQALGRLKRILPPEARAPLGGEDLASPDALHDSAAPRLIQPTPRPPLADIPLPADVQPADDAAPEGTTSGMTPTTPGCAPTRRFIATPNLTSPSAFPYVALTPVAVSPTASPLTTPAAGSCTTPTSGSVCLEVQHLDGQIEAQRVQLARQREALVARRRSRSGGKADEASPCDGTGGSSCPPDERCREKLQRARSHRAGAMAHDGLQAKTVAVGAPTSPPEASENRPPSDGSPLVAEYAASPDMGGELTV